MPDFRMPAEWEPQSCTWFSWPSNAETWPDNLEAAQREFVDLVLAVAQSQLAKVLVRANQKEHVYQQFSDHDHVELIEIATNDAWARDYAPTFVVDTDRRQLFSIDWYYNAWGEKYPPYELDQQVAYRIATLLGIENLAGGLCLEGGAIEVNGAGALITTESCVLHSNRNAAISKPDAESILRSRLGCKKIVWLPGDVKDEPLLDGDDTDGHIDQFARFVDDKTIVHAATKPSDSRFLAIERNVKSLRRQLPDVSLIPLELPTPIARGDRTIPASYCNFLITNDSVIVPGFGASQDLAAVETLAGLFPDRKVISLSSIELSVGLGSFHCLSQQQPLV